METDTVAVTQLMVNSNQLAKPKRGRREVFAEDEEQQQVNQSEIKNLLLVLSSKMDAMNNTMAGNDERLNARIHNLESVLSTKILEVKRLVDSEMITRNMCTENITKSENDINVRVNELQS